MIISNQQNPKYLHLQMCAKEERRGARRAAGLSGWLVLGSMALMIVVQQALYLLLDFAGALDGDNSTLLEYLVSCIGYLFLALIPMAFIVSNEYPAEEFLPFGKPKQVGLGGIDVLLLCSVGMMLTLAANWPTALVQHLLQMVGLSGTVPDMPLDQSAGTQVFYLVYGTVIPPLVEEILFRGAVLGCLRRWGDGFAIAASSILFGLYHGNVGQFVFATLVGLVFGYLRVRTGNILPSMLLHMLNNGLAAVASLLNQNFGGETSGMFSTVYFIVVFALALVLLLLRLIRQKKDGFQVFHLAERHMASTQAGRMRGLVTSVGSILMVVYGVVSSISRMVQR